MRKTFVKKKTSDEDWVRFKKSLWKSWRPEWGVYSDAIMSVIGDICDGESIIEVGCGNGRYTIPLAKRGAYITGVDICREALDFCIEKARRQGVSTRINLIVADAENLPLRNDTFDKSICIGVLVHIANYKKVIDEMIYITRKGGHIITENTSLLNPIQILEKLKNLFSKRVLGRARAYSWYPRIPWQIIKPFKRDNIKIECFSSFYRDVSFLIRRSLYLYSRRDWMMRCLGSGKIVKARKLG